MLMMSATPIPRTLAMSYYADLDVSTIDELPPGRTQWSPKLISDSRREEVIERIGPRWRRATGLLGLPADRGKRVARPDQRHRNPRRTERGLAGRDGGAAAFAHGAAGEEGRDVALHRRPDAVLVSTTVIEVGVDVPNASLMVIEHAERFGLSQLHQLRGRVGRGAAASAAFSCIRQATTGAWARPRVPG